MGCKSCGTKGLHERVIGENAFDAPVERICVNCKNIATLAEILGHPWWRVMRISKDGTPLKLIMLCPKCYEDPENRKLERYAGQISYLNGAEVAPKGI